MAIIGDHFIYRSKNSSRWKLPGRLVFVYLFLLCFSGFMASFQGDSSLIDEFTLLALGPFAIVGLQRYFFSERLISKLLLIYFFSAGFGAILSVYAWFPGAIPQLAPVVGLALDFKLLFFLGGLVYFSGKSLKQQDKLVSTICKSVCLITLINVPFFLVDVFSSGTSLSGHALSPSLIYGYAPIGLMSHKFNTAMLSALAFSSAVVLYLQGKHLRYMLLAGLFAIVLFLSSSMKELSVLVALFIIVARLCFRRGKLSTGGNALFLVVILLLPILIPIIYPFIHELFVNRWTTYAVEESVRGKMYAASAQIAINYFPIGTGAGTFSSQPSFSMYYSPLYYEYGLAKLYGASPEMSKFLMDTGWPKFIAEAGWIGGGAYILCYLFAFLVLAKGFLNSPSMTNVMGIFLGALIFSSALGAAVFTSDIGLVVCATFFFMAHLEGKYLKNMSNSA